jgi:hypothetical protein
LVSSPLVVLLLLWVCLLRQVLCSFFFFSFSAVCILSV